MKTNRFPVRSTLGYISILLLLVFLPACASVSPQSVDLSCHMGDLIRESRRTHTSLARQYFQEKQNQIDQFTRETSTPHFIDNLFERGDVQQHWNNILQMSDRSDQYARLSSFTNSVQKQVSEKRQELLEPINRAEELMLRRLDQHYDELLEANAQVTGLLGSATELQQTREAALRTIDPTQTTSRYIDNTQTIVNKVTEGVNAFQRHKEDISKTLEELSSESEEQTNERTGGRRV